MLLKRSATQSGKKVDSGHWMHSLPYAVNCTSPELDCESVAVFILPSVLQHFWGHSHCPASLAFHWGITIIASNIPFPDSMDGHLLTVFNHSVAVAYVVFYNPCLNISDFY